MEVPEVKTPPKKEDIFAGLLPAASESPLDPGALDPPQTGTGPTDSPVGVATPGEGAGKVAGQAGSPVRVVQSRAHGRAGATAA